MNGVNLSTPVRHFVLMLAVVVWSRTGATNFGKPR
jgi:hypothetical protein